MRDRLEAELSDRYLIEREVGRGGMATVWLARDRRHDRPVAIKVLHAALAGAMAADRFAREVRVTARLQHPSIVPVIDSGVLPAVDDVPLPWYAMAYVAGESLRERLARDVQLPIDEALRITQEVAAALSVAHQHGIVHRDIKPENILLADGRVYVVDFGIAKALLETGEDRLTGTGLALGTPAYMSPEQASAAPVDARSDQYSLAAVLYEMLAGEPPFTAANAQAVIARRLAEPARPIRSVRSAVPEAVEEVVLRALERVPADRFADIAAFAAELERAQAAIASRPSRRRILSRRVPVAVSLLATTALVGVAVVQQHGKAAPSVPDRELQALVQRGTRSYNLRTTAGAVDAIQSFRAAIARDSTYALGWVGLAKTYVRVVERQFAIPGTGPDSILRLAVTAVDRALALDTADAEAWAALAAVSRKVDPTDVSVSLRAARKAIALDSLNAQARHFLALGLAESGDMQVALDAWRQCVRQSPAHTLCLAFLALGHYWQNNYDSAAVWADSVVDVEPNYPLGRMTMGQIEIERKDFARAVASFEAAWRLSTDVEAANALAGRALVEARAHRIAEARATLRAVDSAGRAYSPTPLHTTVYIAQAHAALGDKARALWWLQRYPIRQDLHYQLHLRCDPPFAAIANERGYRALLVVRPPGGAC